MSKKTDIPTDTAGLHGATGTATQAPVTPQIDTAMPTAEAEPILQDSLGSKPYDVETRLLEFMDYSLDGKGQEKQRMRQYRVVRAGNLHVSKIARIIAFGGIQAITSIGVDISIFYETPADDAETYSDQLERRAAAEKLITENLLTIIAHLLTTNEEVMLEFAACCIKKGDGSSVTYKEIIDGDLFPIESGLVILTSFFTTNDVTNFLSQLSEPIQRAMALILAANQAGVSE